MVKETSPPFLIVSSVSVSGVTTFTSSASGIIYRDSVGYQVNWTGTPTGTVQINGSLDYSPGLPQTGGPANAGAWATITSQAVGSGTSQPVIFNLTQLAMPWTQLQFVSSTSSGVIAAYVSAKSLG